MNSVTLLRDHRTGASAMPRISTTDELTMAETLIEMLEEKISKLEAIVHSVSHGVATTDARGRVVIHNQCFLDLLALPQSLMDEHPTHQQILRHQHERGDFGENFELIEAAARESVARAISGEQMPPLVYIKRTKAGRVLAVNVKDLPQGGRVITYEDVTSFYEIEEKLRESVDRFRSLTELSSDWYWEQDDQFRFTRFDGQLAYEGGIATDIFLGKTRWEMGAINLTDEDWQAHQAVLQAHLTFHDFELQRLDAEGNEYWASLSGTPIMDDQGCFRGYRGIGHTITERKRAEDETQHLAFYDTLTGLPNRRLLLDRLSQALTDLTHSKPHGALLFIDLDKFKRLNDTLGHHIGDMLLQQVAQRLLACVRETDMVARLGGDEFVVVLEHLSETSWAAATLAETVGEKILLHLNQPYQLGIHQHNNTPSIGITLFGNQTETVDELLARADFAMYQAKSAGRNAVHFFDPDLQATVDERTTLENDMRLGLEDKQLLFYYQPQVDVSGCLLGAEVLVRWLHPTRGMILPNEFISLAERSGLILPLGHQVLEAACAQLVLWASSPDTDHLTLAVNVSAPQIHQPDFVDQVLSVLDYSGANPARLKLEITESMLLKDIEGTIAKMTRLKRRGVGFSLDDFGTGYSSLTYLKRLPLDQLKIDQSFVRDLMTDTNDAAIVRAILSLGQSMGLTVIAEGVETEDQREFLSQHGCKSYQGYLFGRPGPVEDLLSANSETV